MKYTVYKITNKINGKIYVGAHQTKNLNDNYMGSGKLIRRAIRKYGADNFEREWLHIFETPEDMFFMESKIVNEDFVNDEQTYNLTSGGSGSWAHVHNEENYKRLRKQAFSANKLAQKKLKILRKDKSWNARLSQSLSKASTGNQNWLGKTHTEETKTKIGKANSKHQKGSKNSQYGTCWITNGSENKKVKKENLEKMLTEGWKRGRVMKRGNK